MVGFPVSGTSGELVGRPVGNDVGRPVSPLVGCSVGFAVGLVEVGCLEGSSVDGAVVGRSVRVLDGVKVGDDRGLKLGG